MHYDPNFRFRCTYRGGCYLLGGLRDHLSRGLAQSDSYIIFSANYTPSVVPRSEVRIDLHQPSTPGRRSA